MRQTIPLHVPSVSRCTRGLCRLSPVPAGEWPFPTLSLRPLCRCSDPCPAVTSGCSTHYFPGNTGLTSRETGSAHGNIPAWQLLQGTVFRGCNHSFTFGLLHSLDPQTAPTIAALRPPGGQAFHTTHSLSGCPVQDVASLHDRHGQLSWLDSHQLGRSLVGCSFPHPVPRKLDSLRCSIRIRNKRFQKRMPPLSQ